MFTEYFWICTFERCYKRIIAFCFSTFENYCSIFAFLIIHLARRIGQRLKKKKKEFASFLHANDNHVDANIENARTREYLLFTFVDKFPGEMFVLTCARGFARRIYTISSGYIFASLTFLMIVNDLILHDYHNALRYFCCKNSC